MSTQSPTLRYSGHQRLNVETVTASALARMARRAAERGVRGVGGGESHACGPMMHDDRSIAAWRAGGARSCGDARSSTAAEFTNNNFTACLPPIGSPSRLRSEEANLDLSC